MGGPERRGCHERQNGTKKEKNGRRETLATKTSTRNRMEEENDVARRLCQRIIHFFPRRPTKLSHEPVQRRPLAFSCNRPSFLGSTRSVWFQSTVRFLHERRWMDWNCSQIVLRFLMDRTRRNDFSKFWWIDRILLSKVPLLLFLLLEVSVDFIQKQHLFIDRKAEEKDGATMMLVLYLGFY